MRKRIPVDIQFLYESVLGESIIKEDPDSPSGRDVESHDMERLEADGVDEEAVDACINGYLDYTDEEAVAFIYFIQQKMFVYRADTHGDIMNVIRQYREGLIKGHFEDNNNYGDIMFVVDVYRGRPLMRNDDPSWRDAFVLNFSGVDAEVARKFMESAPTPQLRVDLISSAILGRVWTLSDSMVISFWNKASQVQPHIKTISSIIDGSFGLSAASAAYEFDGTIYSLKQMLQSGETKPEMSDDEHRALLAKQHLDPKAKEKLTGDDYRTQHLKKHAQGHDFAAKANARKQTSDGVISPKDLIKESPDEVYLKPDNETPDLTYKSGDAMPFIYDFRTGLTLYSKSNQSVDYTHWEILTILRDVKTYIENHAYSESEARENFVKPSFWGEMFPSIDVSKKIIRSENGCVHYIGSEDDLFNYLWTRLEYMHKEPHPDEFRENGVLGLLGRAWKNHNVVSLWNKTSICLALKKKGILDKIIKTMDFSPEDVLFSPGDSLEVIPYSEFGSKEVKTMSADEYKALLAKQHLDASAKRKLAGDDYRMAHLKKHSKGYDFAAKADAARPMREAVLNEDPETMFIGTDGRVEYDDSDAHSFSYFYDHNIYIEGDKKWTYHESIISMIERVASGDVVRNGNVVECRIYGEPHKFYIKGRVEGFETMCRVLASKENFDDFDDRSDVRLWGFLGRHWKGANAISFWAEDYWEAPMVKKGILKKILDFTSLDQSKPIHIGFGNEEGSHVLGGDEENTSVKISDDEYRKNLAKQHLDPEAKKKLSGDNYRDVHMKKHAQGHDFAAVANARKQTSDGVIRLKDLIDPS